MMMRIILDVVVLAVIVAVLAGVILYFGGRTVLTLCESLERPRADAGSSPATSTKFFFKNSYLQIDAAQKWA